MGPPSPRPLDNRGGGGLPQFSSALRASVFKNNGGRALHWIRHWVDNPSNISKPTTVSEHFLTDDHSANDTTLIPLKLIKSNRKSVLKARAAYLIERERQNSWTIGYHSWWNVIHSLFLPFEYLHYFYFLNFFHTTNSTVFVFIYFQRLLKFSCVILVPYCTLSFILNCNVLA